MRALILLTGVMSLEAQVIQISHSTTARGGAGSVLVRLESPSTARPTSLQWDLSVGKEVTVDMHDILAGSSAESAEKSIACAARPQDNTGARYRCIVSGGRKPIENGTIAIVKYTVQRNARPGNAAVRIENALGVSKDLKPISFPNIAGEITIR